MSVENNSARSIDGLNTLSCDVINITESIEIDGDNGNNNQLLTSDGTRTLWRDLSALLAQLTVSAPLSFVAGAFYDGSVARAIQIADGAIGNVKLEHSTISGVSLGGTLNNLTFGNGISAIDNVANPATLYNGSELIGLSIEAKSGGGITVDSDGLSLTNDTISGISLGNNLFNLNVSNPLSFSGAGPNNYDGSQTKTIQIANGAIGNAKLENNTISGKALGSNLENLHIGNGLLGVDLSDASSTTEYRGDVNVGIAVNPKAGGGLTADGTGLFLTNDTISGRQLGTSLNQLTLSTPLSFTTGADFDGGTARTIQIGNIANAKLQNSTISGVSLGSDLNNLTAGTGLELDSGTTYNGSAAKHIHLKPENQTISDRVFYEDTGVGSERYLFVINSGDWRPNDDSSFYNISIDDDINKLTGRGRTMNTSLEAMGVFTIPQGWTPTGIFVDVRDGSGNAEPETLNVYKVRNWNGVNSAVGPDVMLGSSTTNTERTFTGSYGASTSQFCLLVKVHLNSTIDYIGGGYIVLTAPTSGDDY